MLMDAQWRDVIGKNSHLSTQPNSWSMVWQLMVPNKLRYFIAWLQWKNINEILDGGWLKHSGGVVSSGLCPNLLKGNLFINHNSYMWNWMFLPSFGVVIRDTADANIAAWCDLRYMDANKDSFNQWTLVYLMLAIWWTTWKIECSIEWSLKRSNRAVVIC